VWCPRPGVCNGQRPQGPTSEPVPSPRGSHSHPCESVCPDEGSTVCLDPVCVRSRGGWFRTCSPQSRPLGDSPRHGPCRATAHVHLAVKSPHDMNLTVALTPSITISLKFVSLGALPTSLYLVPWAFVTRRACVDFRTPDHAALLQETTAVQCTHSLHDCSGSNLRIGWISGNLRQIHRCFTMWPRLSVKQRVRARSRWGHYAAQAA